MKQPISTDAAPAAIGTYSQAVAVRGSLTNLVFISGQIPLDPVTMEVVGDDVALQTEQVFRNLAAVAEAAGGNLGDMVKLTVYLTDLSNFSTVNEIMARHMAEPYPARAAVGVSELPRGVGVEIDAIMVPSE